MGSDEPRVVVTGAAGFVGLNVVEHLLTAGFDTVAVDSAELPAAARADFSRLPGSLHAFAADILDRDAMGRAVAGASHVIHAAAVTSSRERDRLEGRRVVEVNVLGTQAALDSIVGGQLMRRFVYVSSGAVYGTRVFGAETIDEATTPDPVTLYGTTKLAAEMLVRDHTSLHGTDAVIARLSAVFGPWERATGVRDSVSPMRRIALARRDGARVVHREDAPRNWLYARDAAAALVGLALAPRHGHNLYNVSPIERFEPMQWAHHLGVEIAAEADAGEASVVVLPGEDRREERRAPVSSDLIRRELMNWPGYGTERAFSDYREWLDSHDAYG